MPTASGYMSIDDDRCNSIIHIVLGAGLVTIVGVLMAVALYLFIIALALLQVAFNIAFQDTMIFLIGKHAYAVNFPICTATEYNGNDCYTTVSTYCT